MMIALSFGAGRQTTAMIVLAAQGEIPKPDYVMFADTGWEWPETYDYMERYMKPLLAKMGIPFVTVKGRAKGYDNLYDWLWHYYMLPMVINRSCTDKFKVTPLHRFIREQGIETEWIGFSADEQGRAARKLERHHAKFGVAFPLIEEGIYLTDCAHIIERYGLPVPLKSACVFCAFQHPRRTQMLYKRHPDLFEKVGQLEDRALERSPGFYILYDKAWRNWANIQLELFGEDWNYGCQDGYCFR